MRELKIENNIRLALVDDEDYDRLVAFKWIIDKQGNCIHRRAKNILRNKYISLSNEIFQTRGIIYDHINRNCFLNTKENLRPCTVSQNGANRKKQKGTSSIYKGVYLFKRDNKWKVHIKVNGKEIYLGVFLDELEAAKAYDAASIKYFGEFAALNFPIL